MIALYLIGGALTAAMWLGLIYVMVVEPIRARGARAADRYVYLPPRRLSLSRPRHDQQAFGYAPRHFARGH
jgi:hypothetical protein